MRKIAAFLLAAASSIGSVAAEGPVPSRWQLFARDSELYFYNERSGEIYRLIESCPGTPHGCFVRMPLQASPRPEVSSADESPSQATPKLPDDDEPRPRLRRTPARPPPGRPQNTGIEWGPIINPPQPRVEHETPSMHRGVSPPRAIRRTEPLYTQRARDQKVEGTVELAMEVWEDGKAHNIRVIRSLGHGLDESAIECVKQWRFVPGQKDGKPVRVAVEIHVNFRLVQGPE